MRKLFLLVAALVFGSASWARSGEPIRLALVPQSGGILAATDVLTAKLSRNPELQLLERSEIDKIYREQSLSAGNRDLLKLGQILGADGLLLLDLAKEGDKEFLAVRLVAVKPGVVLINERFPWPLTGIAEWSQGVADHLRPLIPKLIVLQKDAIPISILNLRSSVQTDDARELERELTVLTTERLGREPRLFVLERRSMNRLTDENEWGGLDDSGFWTGSFLLEGTIDPDGYSESTMTISASLKPPNGGAIVPLRIACARADLSGVVNQLAEKTLAALKIADGPSWNRVEEAEQYLTEAKWAYRWRLFAQSRDASESAWALGRQTPEVAELRIRSYAEPVWSIPENVVGNRFPAVPDSRWVDPLERAAGLFEQELQRLFPSEAPLDADWFMLGFRLLRQISAVLEGYYFSADFRAGHAADISRLQSLSRRLAERLWSRIPAGWLANGLFNRKWVSAANSEGTRGTIETTATLESFYDACWTHGGVWREHPDDAIPFFHAVIERGYHPAEPPRFAAWTWPERARIPSIRDQFIRDLCATTNLETKMAGFYFMMWQAPVEAQGGDLLPGEAELIATFRDHRDWVSNAACLGILNQAGALAASTDSNRGGGRRATEPLAVLREHLCRDYLSKPDLSDVNVFDRLFIYANPRISSKAVVEELIPRMEALEPRVAWGHRIHWVVENYLGEYHIGGAKKPGDVTVSMPGETPLAVQFTPWKLDNTRLSGPPRPRGVLIHGNRLWSRIWFTRFDSESPIGVTESFVSVDPETGDCEEVPFPRERGETVGNFAVTDDSLYVGVRDRLDRYRFRERRWESIPVPIDQGFQIVALGGKLYLADEESLIEVEPDSGRVHLLASSRRQPPQGEMDSAWAAGTLIYAARDGRLGMLREKSMFIYAPSNQSWTIPATRPAGDGRFRLTTYFSDQGPFLLLDGVERPMFLTAFWNEQPMPQLLLRQRPTNGIPVPDIERALGEPVWEWPAPYELDMPCFAANGGSVWVLYPRKRTMNGFITAPVIEYPDDRTCTVMLFDPGTRKPLCVPCRFEKDSDSVNPFDYRYLGGAPTQFGGRKDPYWVATTNGVVLVCTSMAGDWFISRETLARWKKKYPGDSASEEARK